MPSVNQIEVQCHICYNVKLSLTRITSNRRTKASSTVPTKIYRIVLHAKLDCHSGLLSNNSWQNGSPCHPRSGQEGLSAIKLYTFSLEPSGILSDFCHSTTGIQHRFFFVGRCKKGTSLFSFLEPIIATC
jgi:hypothetical protein